MKQFEDATFVHFGIFSLLLFVLSQLLVSVCVAQESYQLPGEIREQIRKRIADGWHLSTVVGLVNPEGSFFYGFGQKSLVDDNPPDERSLYAIGSITKPITATLLVDMALSGELELTATLEQLLSEETIVPTHNGSEILVSDLLTHSSGLPREPYNMDFDLNQLRYSVYTYEQMNEFLLSYQLTQPIGSRIAYSNLGYALLGWVIERQTGQSYEDIVIERIADTLAMSDTRISLTEEQKNRLAQGAIDGDAVPNLDLGAWPAQGALYSTASDLIQFLSANIGLLESALNPAIQFSQVPRGPHYDLEEAQLSYAWEVIESGETGSQIHYFKGQVDGYVTFAGFDRSKRIGVVMLNSGRRYFSDIPLNMLDSTYPLVNPPPNPNVNQN